jgi:predicted lipoprotein with Yx(FWY)xxD motif
MVSFKKLVALPLIAALLVAGCSSAAATPIPAAATPAAATAATATNAPVTGSSATVLAQTAGTAGIVLVAGANKMTVYTFTTDVANSGKSACTAACLVKWPALMVPAGTTPTAGTGVTGTLGTITRADDGTLQVTYNGLPLYFYQGDKAPGDTTGSYPNWNLVKP